MTDYQKNLTKICKDLMLEQPFYGLLLLNLNKEWTDKIETAGVGLDSINYKLYINPKFWSSLNEDQKKGLLQHELMHIAFFHITEYNHLENKKLANIAQDLEINQKIDKKYLPEGGVMFENFQGLGLVPNEGTNNYYEKLLKESNNSNNPMMQAVMSAINNNSPEINNPDGGKTRMPEHDWSDFENLTETEQKLIDRQLEIMLKEVVEQTEKQCGNVPNEVKLKLNKLNQIEPPKFNWRAYLRRYIGNSAKTTMRKTKRKQSKRFSEDFGIRVQEHSHILIAIDSSASVSDSEIKEFMNEIHHMYKSGHDFTIVFADTKMQEPVKYRPNMDLIIKQRGGTDFNPVVDYFIAYKKKYTTLIYLTDGEAPTPKSPIKNILWVLSTKSKMTDHLPGKTIKLN